MCSDAAYPYDEYSGVCKNDCPKVVQISEVKVRAVPSVYRPRTACAEPYILWCGVLRGAEYLPSDERERSVCNAQVWTGRRRNGG